MKSITLDGKACTVVRVQTAKSTLLMVNGSKGFLGCGWFSIDTAEKLGEAVAVVTGVNTVDDVLNAEVVTVSSAAAALGVEPGMNGRAAMALLA
jgi:uncharacterized protein YunC (DUF1805 family)